jgi:SAM-dependent methyltransferase
MKFKKDVLLRYVSEAPLALAFERYLECSIYQELPLERPILDLGCGEGIFAYILFDEKIDTGIDPNPRELKRASEYGGYSELIECFGNKIPKPDGSYNTVFSNSVLEHIPDVDSVMEEVRRILPIGGVFYFTVPSNNFDHYSVVNGVLTSLGMKSLAKKFRESYDRFWKHYHFYELNKWEDLIRSHGFEVTQSRLYDPKRICRTNDFLAPFGVLGFIMKRLTNRWVLIPGVRRAFWSLFIKPLEKFLANGHKSDEGGLVFVAAKRIN